MKLKVHCHLVAEMHGEEREGDIKRLEAMQDGLWGAIEADGASEEGGSEDPEYIPPQLSDLGFCEEESFALDDCLEDAADVKDQYADCSECPVVAHERNDATYKSWESGAAFCSALQSGGFCSDLGTCVKERCPPNKCARELEAATACLLKNGEIDEMRLGYWVALFSVQSTRSLGGRSSLKRWSTPTMVRPSRWQGSGP